MDCDLCGAPTPTPRTVTLCPDCWRDVLGEVGPAERVRRVLLTPSEAARVLGVSPRTIRAMIADGRLRALDLAASDRPHGRRWRIRRRDLVRLLTHVERH